MCKQTPRIIFVAPLAARTSLRWVLTCGGTTRWRLWIILGFLPPLVAYTYTRQSTNSNVGSYTTWKLIFGIRAPRWGLLCAFGRSLTKSNTESPHIRDWTPWALLLVHPYIHELLLCCAWRCRSSRIFLVHFCCAQLGTRPGGDRKKSLEKNSPPAGRFRLVGGIFWGRRVPRGSLMHQAYHSCISQSSYTYTPCLTPPKIASCVITPPREAAGKHERKKNARRSLRVGVGRGGDSTYTAV